MKIAKLAFLIFFMISGCASKTVDRTTLKKEIQNKRYEVFNCYKEQYKKDSQLAGKLLLNWRVNDQGQAENIYVSDSTISNEDLISCVKEVVAKTQFTAAPEGKTIDVKYPWIFSEDSIR